MPIYMSALVNVHTFGWKQALSQVHEEDLMDFKKRAFDRPNEGGNPRESTEVVIYHQVLKSWLRSSVKNTRSYYQVSSRCPTLTSYV
ncbi:hypothetical protein E3N88_39763 [Mikania micrantha]|uniref:Uncharacterized protein n=1 Tax=Mikania micrantha TaxID=192012 RepID=A0A5N6LKT4_9ASTR|nr:hypothetical protein E3N88_39763 [Mikania micrantha]